MIVEGNWWERNAPVALLDHYQQKAIGTAIYPGRGAFKGINYCSLKLAGESGEVAEKVGKVMRDDDEIITEDKRDELIKELGDVLWYIAALATEFNISLSEVANRNIAKLESRQKRGVLGGSGDNR